MDLSRDIEVVGSEILELLSSDEFAARLTAISTEKGDGIDLRPFVSKKYGWASKEEESPALQVLPMREETIKDEGNSRWVWFKFVIEAYVSGDDTEKLERATNRYARAIDEILLQNYSDKGFKQGADFSPVIKYENSLFKFCSLNFWVKELQDTRV